MSRRRVKISKKAGLSPGTFVHIGTQKTLKNSIELLSYNLNELNEISATDFDKISPLLKAENINWINIDGLHNVKLIEKAGTYFNLHPLHIEDILNTQHRPKSEEQEDYVFFTLKLVSNVENDIIMYDQVSLVLGKNFVLSFQEKESLLFDRIKERLKTNGTSRKRKADYLFYRLIDTIVDSYYVALDNINDRLEELEEDIYEKTSNKSHQAIQNLKKDLITFRKAIYPVREAVSKIMKEETSIIEKSTLRHFADIYDHIIHITETIETLRDLTGGLSDAYVSIINYKMNEVIKVLTIISTIFIPLTFIVGIYGMNFEFMPELSWKWGYPAIMAAMLLIATWMLVYMKRKNWF